MVMEVSPPDEPWTTGKGNSPPERNEAFCPLSVVIVGSARICAICLSCEILQAHPDIQTKIIEEQVKGLLVMSVAGVLPVAGV